MQGVFSAEPAILVHLKPIRIVLLVFHCVVVALLTFCASKCDFNSHNGTSRFTEIFFAFTSTPKKRRRKSKRLPRSEKNTVQPADTQTESTLRRFNRSTGSCAKKKNLSEVIVL